MAEAEDLEPDVQEAEAAPRSGARGGHRGFNRRRVSAGHAGAPAEEPRPNRGPRAGPCGGRAGRSPGRAPGGRPRTARPSWRTAGGADHPRGVQGAAEAEADAPAAESPERMGPRPGHAVLRRPSGQRGGTCPGGRGGRGRGRAVTAKRPLYGCRSVCYAVVRSERRTSLTANVAAGIPATGIHAALMAASGCSPWRP